MAQKQKVKVAVKAEKTTAKTPASVKSSSMKPSGARTIGAKVAASAKKTAPMKAKEAAPKKPVKAEVAKKASTPTLGAKKPELKSASSKIQAAAAKLAAAKPQVTKPAPAAAPVQRAVPAAVGKPADQKITAPVPAAPVVQAAPASPKALAEKAAAARGMMAAQKKPVSARHGFKTNEFVVYPAHGVGRIVGIEEQEIAGMSLELFVITFEKEKLTLRVPTGKLASIGMRKLAEESVVKRAMETLKGRARVKRTMWSRRAQEYVAKINSGDLISIAEVVRDLYRSEAQPEQSYSERQLYENALERMARELAAVERLDERGAVQRIVEILSKSAKGRRLAAEGVEVADTDIKAA